MKEVESFYRLLHPKMAFFLVSKWKEKTNLMALAWAMPVDDEANLLAISLYKENFSYELIKRAGEFVLCIPSKEQLPLLWKVGTTSGRKIDKVRQYSIELENGVKSRVPHLKNCLGFIECKVEQELDVSEHAIFLARVLYAAADEKYFDGVWKRKAKPLLHVGSKLFTTLGEFFTPYKKER